MLIAPAVRVVRQCRQDGAAPRKEARGMPGRRYMIAIGIRAPGIKTRATATIPVATATREDGGTAVFMRFLYRGAPLPLENLCASHASKPAATSAGCIFGVRTMLDVLLLAGGLGLFVMTVGYAYA